MTHSALWNFHDDRCRNLDYKREKMLERAQAHEAAGREDMAKEAREAVESLDRQINQLLEAAREWD